MVEKILIFRMGYIPKGKLLSFLNNLIIHLRTNETYLSLVEIEIRSQS